MLEIRGLSCGYSAESVLKKIDFAIKDKDFFGIIGPNGSGKTTLLRAISRTLKLQAGEIIFEKKNIRFMGYKELAKKMAFVSQASRTGPDMTVEEFVLLGRTPYFHRFQLFETGRDKEAVEKAMTLTDTLGIKNRNMGELSGGERQLAVIACALAQEPKLLLLDEPTAHLDITHQVEILDLIRRLNRGKGLTVIMVIHDLNLAGEYCDRLALINKGRIHKIGSPREVLTYQIIEEVYRTTVVVKENPVSLKPYIFMVSEEEKQKTGNKSKMKRIE